MEDNIMIAKTDIIADVLKKNKNAEEILVWDV